MSKMGRPTVDSKAINVRILVEVIDRIDTARKLEKDLPNRPEMIRRMIDEWLSQKQI